MRKSIWISVALAALLSVSTLSAKDVQKGHTSVDKEISTQKKISQKSTPKEVIQAFDDTLKAVQALENADVNTAKKYLKEATTMFDNALKANPALTLLPVATQMQVSEVDATPKEIEKALKLAKDALDGHHLEDARVILATLRDEMIVNTQYIPMDIYPLATKDALKALEKDDTKEALALLMNGFSTTVSDTVVLPLPILTASDMVLAAAALDKENKEDALALLDGAKEELAKAKLLGYTDAYGADYEALSKDIEAIEKEIKGKNVVEKLYDKLKTNFKTLIDKVRGNSYKDSVATKEAKELVQPESIKKMEAAKAKVNATHDKELKEAKAKAQTFLNDSEADKAKTVK